MGDKITFNGDIQKSTIGIRSTFTIMTNVGKSVDTIPTDDQAARAELQHLIEQLSQVLEKVPESKKDEAEAVAASAQTLVENAKAEKPNKALLQISGEGLKKAAENLAEVTPTVLSIAGQVVMAVMHLRGF
jgi:ElaB/YqjD/DUF883 family membrane-anchored ribosome-binding protein